VVTATRTQLCNFDYPGLTSAIRLESLEENRPTDLAQLLEDVPGMEVAGGPRRTGQTINLRGFGRESVTLLIDGARQNFASAHDGVLFLDPGLLGRVETVRGSAAALYGSGAAGGVIAFESIEADDLLGEDETYGARASAGYRSVHQERRGSAAVFADAGDFAGIAALSVRESGDIELMQGTIDFARCARRIISSRPIIGHARLVSPPRRELNPRKPPACPFSCARTAVLRRAGARAAAAEGEQMAETPDERRAETAK